MITPRQPGGPQDVPPPLDTATRQRRQAGHRRHENRSKPDPRGSL
jgi:hypothetical protein